MLQCRETRWATPSRLVLLFIAASKKVIEARWRQKQRKHMPLKSFHNWVFDRVGIFSSKDWRHSLGPLV